jgi:transcriptional regulator with XRE-family HTH domain
MLHDTRRRALEVAQFLRSRRSRLAPSADELRARPRRRVAGLTRGELAARAGVSLTWYSWLEMGRDVRASPQTLTSIARALELNPDETSYLLTLAAIPHGDGSARASEFGADELAALVDGMHDYPAFVVDRRWSVVAANRHAREIYRFVPSDDLNANVLWRLVRDPHLRQLHADPDAMMRSIAAIVRYNFADDPENAQLANLIDALHRDAVFSAAWETYSVRTFAPFDTEIRWNALTLRFRFVALAAGFTRRETLVVHLPADDATRSALTNGAP